MKALFPETIDIAKEILRRKVTFLSAYIRKNSDRPQIHNLMMLYWILQKQDQNKPQSSRWQEVIKIRTESNEMETKRIIHGFEDLVI